MKTTSTFVTRHPVSSYFVLTFLISWTGILVVLGPGGFTGESEPADVRLPFVYIAMLAGPTVAGFLLTGVVSGKAGFHELLSRLLTWRVAASWYAVAIFAAPLLMMMVVIPLSLTSGGYLPAIFASNDKGSLLLTSITAGVMAGVFEELGWTGFAVPRLQRRHGVVATGIVVGVFWGAWHFPLFSGGDLSGAVPTAVFLLVQLFSFLPAYRVLMVWVYDRTGSLLVAVLMHVSLTASTLLLQPVDTTGMRALTYGLVLAAALWLLIAALATATGRRLSPRRPRPRAA